MTDGTFDDLVLNGSRANFNGADGVGNFWIRIGTGAEPVSPALGFNLQNKQVMINGGQGWVLSAGPIASPTITALQNQVNSLQAQIDTIASLQSQINSLRQQVSNLQNTLQADVNGIAQSLVTLAGRCTSLEQRVTDLGG